MHPSKCSDLPWPCPGVPWARFDPLGHYANEQSVALARLRQVIEAAWQAWEARQPDTSPAPYQHLTSDQVSPPTGRPA